MNKIKEKLDEYLEFDSNKLFVDKLVRVFGGAIRDIIADMPINDVDILVGSMSCKMIEPILKSEGYIKSDYLCGRDLQSMYTNVKVINEPRTWIKGNKIIQLIRPSTKLMISSEKKVDNRKRYEEQFYKLISNVDLTCCGVSYDGVYLYENVEDAVMHCLTKKFKTNLGSMYNSDRIEHRKAKLIERGWDEIYSPIDIRDYKIDGILSDINIDYKKEHLTDFIPKFDLYHDF